MEKAAPCGPFLQGSVLILKRFYQRELSESSSRYARMPKRFKPHPYQTGSEMVVNGRPWRKVVGQKPPMTATFEYVEDGVKNIAQGVGAWSSFGS
jgi:hypothetical protein